jgi:hypothetical protein
MNVYYIYCSYFENRLQMFLFLQQNQKSSNSILVKAMKMHLLIAFFSYYFETQIFFRHAIGKLEYCLELFQQLRR